MEKSSKSLSEANQIIHQQRDKISRLEAEVKMLKLQIADETKARYTAWQKVARS